MFIPFSYEQQKIVTDSLIMNYDAGNVSSYTGTGTVWKNLCNTGNDITLVNSPTFTSGTNNSGYLCFNLLSQASQIGYNSYSIVSATSYTINCFTKLVNPSNGSLDMICYGRGSNVFTLGIALVAGTNIIRGFYSRTGTSSIFNGTIALTYNTWNYISLVFTYNTGLTIFVNGVQDTSVAFTGGLYVHPTPGFCTNFQTAGTYYTSGIGAYHIYNKALTQQEIQQNYNTLKGRYGL